MKKEGAIKNIIFFSVILILFLSTFTFAAHLVTNTVTGSNTTFGTVNEDVTRSYNVSVNNTDIGLLTNITSVNITLPAGFIFDEFTNSTTVADVAHTFSNSTSALIWRNATAGALVMNYTLHGFVFNATAATPGNFNITIVTSTAFNSTINLIAVVINDTTAPSSIGFVSPTETNGTNLTRTNIVVNVTATDNGAIDTITVRLFNSSGLLTSNTSTTSPFYSNFSGLSDGVYTFNATVNDTNGNSNSTASRTVIIDNTGPVVNFTDPTPVNYANLSQAFIPANVTAVDSLMTPLSLITLRLFNSTMDQVQVNTSATSSLFVNYTGLANGNYTLNATANDTLGNLISITRIITLDTGNPNITFSCDETDVEVDEVITCTCTGGDSMDDNPSEDFDVNPVTANDGDYTTECIVTDHAGNTNSSTVSFSVTAGSSSSGGGGGSSSSSSGTTWDNTYVESNVEFSTVGTIDQELEAEEKVNIKVSGTIHHVGVLSLTASTATIQVASTPQEATMSVGETKKFEVTGDNFYDVQVTLNSIVSNKADVSISYLHEAIPSDAETPTAPAEEPVVEETEEAPEAVPVESSGGMNRIATISIIIVVLIVIIILVVLFVNAGKKNTRLKH